MRRADNLVARTSGSGSFAALQHRILRHRPLAINDALEKRSNIYAVVGQQSAPGGPSATRRCRRLDCAPWARTRVLPLRHRASGHEIRCRRGAVSQTRRSRGFCLCSDRSRPAPRLQRRLIGRRTAHQDQFHDALRKQRAQLPQLRAIHARHLRVQQDEIRFPALRECQRLAPSAAVFTSSRFPQDGGQRRSNARYHRRAEYATDRAAATTALCQRCVRRGSNLAAPGAIIVAERIEDRTSR